LVKALVKAGHRVRVLDNLSTGSLKNLADALGAIEFVRGDTASGL
jgi:nucleoside-diphosphate-sugar epimerase